MEGRIARALEHFESTSIPTDGHVRFIEEERPDIGVLPNTGGGSELLPRLHLAGRLLEGHNANQVRAHFKGVGPDVAVTVREWDNRMAHILLTGIHDPELTAHIRSAWDSRRKP